MRNAVLCTMAVAVCSLAGGVDARRPDDPFHEGFKDTTPASLSKVTNDVLSTGTPTATDFDCNDFPANPTTIRLASIAKAEDGSMTLKALSRGQPGESAAIGTDTQNSLARARIARKGHAGACHKMIGASQVHTITVCEVRTPDPDTGINPETNGTARVSLGDDPANAAVSVLGDNGCNGTLDGNIAVLRIHLSVICSRTEDPPGITTCTSMGNRNFRRTVIVNNAASTEEVFDISLGDTSSNRKGMRKSFTWNVGTVGSPREFDDIPATSTVTAHGKVSAQSKGMDPGHPGPTTSACFEVRTQRLYVHDTDGGILVMIR